MLITRMSVRLTTVVLVTVLIIEVAISVSLRWLGWYGTGSAIQFSACLVFTLLPLLIAFVILLHKRLKFSVRSLLLVTALSAFFLVLSLMPILRHRAARQSSAQLLTAKVTINEGMDWDNFYRQIALHPPTKLPLADDDALPWWLTSLITKTDSIPTDNSVRDIWLSSDNQCQILAENWERLSSLQSVSISRGVSTEGFRLLQDVLPRFEHLDSVVTNDVTVPSDWYGSLKNIRTLWVWGEGASRGTLFDDKHLDEIVSLSNLEMFMVLGYAFSDRDARTLAKSDSIKRIVLRGTAVTTAGESELVKPDRLVYRN